ncbi:MAG: TatD family hydrolase [Patescibacteria group bacterium]
MLFDSHAHLNFEDFNVDWQTIIADCQKNNIFLINVGSQLNTSQKAIAIAQNYNQGVYAAVALHPIHTPGSSFHPEVFELKEYKDLIASSKKVVAIGETGIDFFHDDKNFDNQKKVFIQHLHLAKEFDLPVIVHARNSKDGQACLPAGRTDVYEEILKILKKENTTKGVIHCFGGTVKQALAFWQQGFFVGFTGIITFPKTQVLAEVIKSLPLEAVLIETDCPWLAPVPFRGQRNVPQYVKYVAQKIAEIRETEYNKIEEQTFKNALNLFNI